MRWFASLVLCLLAAPALGETKLDYLRDQYIQCTRRGYLAEAKGRQFTADRNVDAAAERVLFACRTEEDAVASSLALAMPHLSRLARAIAADFRLRLKTDLVRWFTDLNTKAEPAKRPRPQLDQPMDVDVN